MTWKKGQPECLPSWDSATPATILLSPLSVSYRCYQNQKGRGISTERYFCPVFPHWMGLLSVSPCPAWAARRVWDKDSCWKGDIQRESKSVIQPHLSKFRAFGFPQSPPFCLCPHLRTRWSGRWLVISLHTLLFLGLGKAHGRRRTPTALLVCGFTFTNQGSQIWAEKNS